MKSAFKITIPKPCHENWNKMTPNEKGKFCNSCSKTVVDFTKKSNEEIQEYLIENHNKSVCGHFYKKQLESIVIEIPENTFEQQLSYQKLFLLALLFVMGTTLFSCQYSDGAKQKIENVVVVDTINKNDIDSLIAENTTQVDSIIKKTKNKSNLDCVKQEEPTDSIIEVVGELETLEGDVEIVEIEMGVIVTQSFPRFKEDKSLSAIKAKENFNIRMNKIFEENITNKFLNNLGLKEGKYRAYVKFEINENGNSSNFQVNAPHPLLKKEILRTLKKLPQFIHNEQDGMAVKEIYSLPITFIVE